MNLHCRKIIAILGTEDFGAEIIPKLEEIIVTRLDRGEVLFVDAAVDGDNEVFKLFCKLNERYRAVSFFAVLASDAFLLELIRSGRNELIEKGLVSFDVALTAQTPENAKVLRDINLIDRADIVIYPKGSRFDDPSFIRKYSFNRQVEIITL